MYFFGGNMLGVGGENSGVATDLARKNDIVVQRSQGEIMTRLSLHHGSNCIYLASFGCLA